MTLFITMIQNNKRISELKKIASMPESYAKSKALIEYLESEKKG